MLSFWQCCDSSLNKSRKTYLRIMLPPGVNFTNILWAAFAPKSFCQKIINPNFKHIKVTQRALVWLSISPIFYEQLFHTKVLYAAFMCLQFGFLIFGKRILAQKLLIKCWWNWHQVAAQVPDVFRYFYLVNNHKIANYSATTEAI